jgi:hypothetical protein
MKQYKNYRYGPYDDKNWVIEELVETKALRDTKTHKKGDPCWTWKFRGYYPNLRSVLERMVDLVGLDGYDRDLLKEIRELKEYIKNEHTTTTN